MGYLRCCANCTKFFSADNRQGSFYCTKCAKAKPFAPRVNDTYMLMGEPYGGMWVLLEEVKPDTFRIGRLGWPEFPQREVHVSKLDPFNRTAP